MHDGSAYASEVMERRLYHTATLVGDLIYVFGGLTEDWQLVNTLHVLDLSRQKWRKIKTSGRAPRVRNGHSAALVDDKILFYGGTTDLVYLASDLVLYDITLRGYSWPNTGDGGPGERTLHTTEYIPARNELFLFGGSNGVKYCNDLFALDPHRMNWVELAPRGRPPAPRVNHSSCLIYPHLYIYGGQDKKSQLRNDLHVLHVETTVPVWTSPSVRGRVPPALFASCLARVQGRLTLICGMNFRGVVSAAYFYNPTRGRWSKARKLAKSCPATGKHALVSAPDKVVILGGEKQMLGIYHEFAFSDVYDLS